MKKLKITKEVGREDIYVSVHTPSEEKEVAQILKQAGEDVNERLPRTKLHSNLTYALGKWGYLDSSLTYEKDTKITIAQLAGMLGVEYPLKTPVEPAVWYVCGDLLLCRSVISGESFGFWRGVWGTDYGTPRYIGEKTWKEAEYSKVKEALVKEAKRRYNDGDVINLIVGSYEGKASESGISLKTFDFDINRNELSCGEKTCYTLFKDGIWADVVEESPIGRQKRANSLRKLFEYNATEDLLVGDLIEEARGKIRKVTITYPCWIDGVKTVGKYTIGGTSEFYTEKEAIAQYVKEKVLEML